MSLRSSIKQAIDSGLAAISDLVIITSLRKSTPLAYQPGVEASTSESLSSIKLVIDKFENDEVKSDLYVDTDLKVFFPQIESVVPEAGDKLSINGLSYEIFKLDLIYLQNEVIAAKAICRRSDG